MKKLLLSAAALTMLAGAAQAKVDVTGDARILISYNGTAGTTQLQQRTRVFFNMSTDTDAGVNVYSKIGLDSRTNQGAAAGANNSQFRQLHPVFGVMYSGFHVKIGNSNGAVVDQVGLWNGGLGVDGSLGRPAIVDGFDTDEESNQSINAAYSFGDFTVAVSTQIAGDTDTEFAAKYAANGISVAIGGDSSNNWAAGASYSGGAYTIGALIADGPAYLQTVYRLYGTYTMGDTTIGVNYTFADWDNTGAGGAHNATDGAYGIGVTQKLGGGVSAIGAIGTNQAGDMVAQLGLSVGF